MTCNEQRLTRLNFSENVKAEREAVIQELVQSDFLRIRGLAYRFGVDENELDDAAQEVFAKAWVGLKDFNALSSPSTWLTRIAINHLSTRRRKRRLQEKLQVPSINLDDVSVDDGPDPREAAALREIHQQTIDCVGRLPVKLKQVFVLRYLEELSVEEVASLVEIPEGTVRSRLYHARRRLRRMMRGKEI